jgi:hypothetical protein
VTRPMRLAIVCATAILVCGATAARAQQPPELVLTLDDAVQRALERNLDIQVERLNPQALDFNIAALEALFRPTLTSTLAQRSQVNPPTSQLNGGQRVINETTTYNAGVQQFLPGGAAATPFSGTTRATTRATSSRTSTRATRRTSPPR